MKQMKIKFTLIVVHYTYTHFIYMCTHYIYIYTHTHTHTYIYHSKVDTIQHYELGISSLVEHFLIIYETLGLIPITEKIVQHW
jgi:hypothetical protein